MHVARFVPNLCAAGFLALTLSAQGEEPAPAPFLPPPVAISVREAWANNLLLAQREVDLDLALSRLSEVKASLGPQFDLLGRYTRSDGGRTIDLPLGDLLNGAYATLNEYLTSQGRPAAFQPVANQSVPLLRSREQETKVRLLQPLWRPELTRLTRATRFSLEAETAQVAAYRRELAHMVASAHLGALAAEDARRIWAEAREVTAEAVRVNQVLFAHDKVTEDALLRAQAEALSVEESLLAAERDLRSARMQLNFLLNRDLEAPVPVPEPGELDVCINLLNTWVGRPTAGRRPELVALDAALAATAERESAVRARLQPVVGLAVEGGIQGESYRADKDSRFVQGSVVAEVNLWDGQRRRQQIVQAKAEHRRILLQREEVALQLELRLARAWDEFLTARASMGTSRGRAEAAAKTLAIVTYRQGEGVANLLSFLDARQEQTAAALQASIARYRLVTAASAVELARGESDSTSTTSSK